MWQMEMCGLRTHPLADADPQNFFLDPRTVSGCLVDENLRTRTDADPVILKPGFTKFVHVK